VRKFTNLSTEPLEIRFFHPKDAVANGFRIVTTILGHHMLAWFDDDTSYAVDKERLRDLRIDTVR